MTLSNKPVTSTEFAFFCLNVGHLRDKQRRFELASNEISLFNPNTRTTPIFRTRADAELTRKIYRYMPVMVNDNTGENIWSISFLRMIDLANDSGLFEKMDANGRLPLYEAKMMEQFDHRWATYEGDDIRDTTLEEKQNPNFTVRPQYWIPSEEVITRLKNVWDHDWLIAFRNITRAVDRRTMWFNILPKMGVGHSAPLLLPQVKDTNKIACLIGNLNSMTLDFVVVSL